jgi:hypothetical protein
MVGSDTFFILTQSTQPEVTNDEEEEDALNTTSQYILNDQRPHKWIKQQTQEATHEKYITQEHKPNSRRDYLHYLPICDRKRSFQLANRQTPKKHHVFTTLARMRFHAPARMTKLCRYHNKEWTDPYRQYMKAMYPDPYCHFCGKLGIQVEEDTQHLLSCRNRTSRNEASTQLWTSIWEDIASKQQNTKPATLKKSKSLIQNLIVNSSNHSH